MAIVALRLIKFKKARDSKLTIEDMAGGTFTISNVSVKLLYISEALHAKLHREVSSVH